MNDIITVNEGIAILNPETASKIAECERKIKEIKDAEDALRTAILEAMEKQNVKKIETPELSITYKSPYDKETFQSKQFRADHPDLYDDYVSITTAKASIMIKLKEEKADE